MTLIGKVLWNACASGGSSVARLSAGIIVARQLGSEAMGQLTYLLWVTEILALILSVGMPQALIRYLSNAQGKDDTVAQERYVYVALRAYLGISIAAATAIYSLASRMTFDAGVTASPPSAALAALIVAQLWAGLGQAILTGLQRFRIYALVALFSSMLLLVGQAVGVVLLGIEGAIYGATASSAIAAISVLFIVNHTQHMAPSLHSGDLHSHKLSRSFFTYAVNAWLAAIISSITWGRFELFFVERYGGSREAGFFSVGLMFSSLIVQMVALVSGALLPHFSQAIGAGEHPQVNRDYRRLTLAIAIVAFPISLGGMALMPELMALTFGGSYQQGVTCARWLIATGLWSFATVGSSVVYGYGDAKIIMQCSLLGGIILVAGCYILTPVFGAAGAAATRWGVNGCMVAIGSYLLYHRYAQPFPARSLIKTFIAAAACALAALCATGIFATNLLRLLSGTIIGALTYLICLRWLHVIAQDDAEVVSRLIAHLPPFLCGPTTAVLKFMRI